MEMSVREARSQFAAALSAAGRGERVIITKRGKPIAELGPPSAPAPKKWDWDELDRLQEELGIPTPSPEAGDYWERHFDSPEFAKEIWGNLYP